MQTATGRFVFLAEPPAEWLALLLIRPDSAAVLSGPGQQSAASHPQEYLPEESF